MPENNKSTRLMAEGALRKHFGKRQANSLVTASRTFPVDSPC
jgi:hypothetical protein